MEIRTNDALSLISELKGLYEKLVEIIAKESPDDKDAHKKASEKSFAALNCMVAGVKAADTAEEFEECVHYIPKKMKGWFGRTFDTYTHEIDLCKVEKILLKYCPEDRDLYTLLGGVALRHKVCTSLADAWEQVGCNANRSYVKVLKLKVWYYDGTGCKSGWNYKYLPIDLNPVITSIATLRSDREQKDRYTFYHGRNTQCANDIHNIIEGLEVGHVLRNATIILSSKEVNVIKLARKIIEEDENGTDDTRKVDA